MTGHRPCPELVAGRSSGICVSFVCHPWLESPHETHNASPARHFVIARRRPRRLRFRRGERNHTEGEEGCRHQEGRHPSGSDAHAGECAVRRARAAGARFLEGRSRDKPTPLLFFIHGGGWMAGDKARVQWPAREVSRRPASRSSRSITASSRRRQPPGVKPPVKAPLHDAARALQFVRSKAAEWNIDKPRIGASGRFGGRVLEPLAGVSSRPGRSEEQRSHRARIHAPLVRRRERRADHARPAADEGVDAQQQLRRPRLRLQPATRRRSSRSSTSSSPSARRSCRGSPSIRPTRSSPPTIRRSISIYTAPPALGQEQKDPTHTANFGVKLQETLQEPSASRANSSIPARPT